MARSKKLKIDFKSIAINALAISGGAAASGLVDSLLLSKIGAGTLDPKIKGLIKIGAGAFIPPMLKAPFIEKFGDGMIAMGGYQLLHTLLPGQIPAIAGLGNIPPYPQVQMGSIGDQLPMVSGETDLSTVSGIGDEQNPDFFV